jgi:hypothetical protein
MTNKPKAIGTAAETGVVRYCQPNGFPFAERLALHGALDEGDVQLCPGVVLEVKGGKRAETASDALIASWLDETEAERVNRRADVAALVTKRKGKGAPNAGQWWAYLPGWAFVCLAMTVHRVDVNPLGMSLAHAELPAVRITLAELVELLRRAGWGDPIREDV